MLCLSGECDVCVVNCLWVCFEAIKYDAAKEERYLQEAKQKELQRIEEALQLAARRGKYSTCYRAGCPHV